ncbi:hypothetical protein [Acidicapsa ligni]|uniref:hypothetical protein n=1 Tax=Acidicapsa ligni TaxID=542300 RepID=UPI0021E0623A|nr:hypothetical protein [Acidicapsa ligni]
MIAKEEVSVVGEQTTELKQVGVPLNSLIKTERAPESQEADDAEENTVKNVTPEERQRIFEAARRRQVQHNKATSGKWSLY